MQALAAHLAELGRDRYQWLLCLAVPFVFEMWSSQKEVSMTYQEDWAFHDRESLLDYEEELRERLHQIGERRPLNKKEEDQYDVLNDDDDGPWSPDDIDYY
jgi:hypothetical protein